MAPDSGQVHVFRWKQGELAACPGQPTLSAPEYLGAFGADMIPNRLVLDSARHRLIVGYASHDVFPIKPGALFFYDLANFPSDLADMDKNREDKSPAQSMRVTYPNVYGLLLDGDALYMADFDNGLFKYSFSQDRYVAFYPAHRGTMRDALLPQLVKSPLNVTPLYHPVAVALAPSGRVMVQESVTGRLSILIEADLRQRVYLPLVIRSSRFPQ
jgi:hypothetical protein